MREAGTHNRVLALNLGLAGLVAAGCAANAPLKADPEDAISVKRSGEVRLINEGGPVFAMPGEVLLLAGTPGLEGMKVTAERVDGSKVLSVPTAPIAADGSFDLRGPMSTGVFFATTVVEDQDAVYRMRALVRPENDKKIVIDTASSLIAADIIQASKRHQKAELGGIFDRTAQLTTRIREAVPADQMRGVGLSGSNDALVGQLHALTSAQPALYAELVAWEEMLHGGGTAEAGPQATAGGAAENQPPAVEPPK